MKVLIGCEESQEVCKAFRALGYEAYSCDLQECSGGHPEWHIQGDVFDAIKTIQPDLFIGHPPCTYMSRAGACRMYPVAGEIDKARLEKAMEARKFFMELMNVPVEFIAIENPTPLKVVELPNHSQALQPYNFGESFSKKTLLWLKNLPPLMYGATNPNFIPYLPSNTGGKKRGQKHTFRSISQKQSSKTFPGIARAMAEQWGSYVSEQLKKKSA